MKRIASLITGLALAVSAAHAAAPASNQQPPAHPTGPTDGSSTVRQRPQSPPIMTALDADRDGIISAQEIASASAALLKLDKDNDKQLTRDEVRPVRRNSRPAAAGDASVAASPKPAGSKPRPSPLMAALDADGDGKLSAQEIANAPATLAKLDKNNDGQLTRDEYRASRPRASVPQIEDGKSGEQDQPASAVERPPRASKPRAAK